MIKEPSSNSETLPVAVVGGGLAGLTAAVELADEGVSVVLFESADELGGRAKTRKAEDFRFNLGPRALYVQGAGKAVLDRLGVTYRGHRPPLKHGSVLVHGEVSTLPMGLWSLMTCPWMGVRERFEVAGFMARLPRIRTESLAHLSTAQWLDQSFRLTMSRRLIEALLQLTTYCRDFEHLEARAAVRQLKTGLSSSVLYLDGGWGTLVASLRELAMRAGVRIETGTKIESVAVDDGGIVCESADGRSFRAAAVVLAVGPEQVDRLIGSKLSEPAPKNRHARPVFAACLDVALSRLPRPNRLFAQGIDVPYYFSVHSAAAKLAPENGALVHVLRYLEHGESWSREQIRQQLEGVLDQMQPGWREVLVDQQLLPKMRVCHDLPGPGRPRAASEVGPGIFVAGDWVGDEGLLADAAIASGSRAARSILQRQKVAPRSRRTAQHAA